MDCDRISTLPEALLTHILSFLETKDSVTTSALSKRWKYLWRRVPALELNCKEYPYYSEVFDDGSTCFIDKYLEFYGRSRMQKFKISYENDINSYRVHYAKWIDTMVDLGLQHLDVEALLHGCFDRDPMSVKIYTSKTLVSLKLSNVELTNPDPKVGVFLPCLKIMDLKDIWYDDLDDDDASVLEKLISGCPVLEDLMLCFPYNPDHELQNVPFVRVRSQTLKTFRCWFGSNLENKVSAVEIDAPKLTYMRLCELQSERIVVKNLSSLSMININCHFNVKHGRTLHSSSKRDMISDFLTGISTVRNMYISVLTLEVLIGYSRLGQIPKFENLYRLQVELPSSMLTLFPAFLESFPNLNKLILEESFPNLNKLILENLNLSTETETIKLSNVPQCLISSLECVEIRPRFMVEESIKELVRYFLEKSPVLKKLILRIKNYIKAHQHSKDIFDEFRTIFTKLPRRCQIIIISSEETFVINNCTEAS